MKSLLVVLLATATATLALPQGVVDQPPADQPPGTESPSPEATYSAEEGTSTATTSSFTSVSTYNEACEQAPPGYDTCKDDIATWSQNMVPAIELTDIKLSQKGESAEEGSLTLHVKDDDYEGTCELKLPGKSVEDGGIEGGCAPAGEDAIGPIITYFPKGQPGGSGKPAIEYGRFYVEDMFAYYFALLSPLELTDNGSGMLEASIPEAKIWYTGGERIKANSPEEQESLDFDKAAQLTIMDLEWGSPEEAALDKVHGSPQWPSTVDPRGRTLATNEAYTSANGPPDAQGGSEATGAPAPEPGKEGEVPPPPPAR
ncbi:hypothetical protein BDZ85DRAFT_103105 [Elsinoe ampelina]|uniref:Uncharacterized protein n=1 Tax=Elsinoe ampelina TaxID=302913 RepID=A0A6A6GFI3_9PEZI|nr:hypothetical protein BDZ85DRAFT_103105 [Elsinoe ampelina]